MTGRLPGIVQVEENAHENLRHQQHVRAVMAMKPTPSAKAIQPARVTPSAVARPVGAPHPHRHGLPDAERNHEAERRDLEGDAWAASS